MIGILATRRGRHTVHEYLAGPGRQHLPGIRSLTYERARSRSPRALGPGLYVFADIERLDGAAVDAARTLWEALQSRRDRYRTLNEPGRTMKRLALLQTLHDEGINDFRVWPVSEAAPPDVRFPVFVRAADDHLGPLGGLVPDHAALGEALARARSLPTSDGLICCEWAGWQHPDGLYRKYSAMVVGDTIIPRHLLFSRHWMVKKADLVAPALLAEERCFLRDNPHADLLSDICRMARVDYGRVDYDTRPDGSLRIWEINTNPMLVPVRMDPASPRWDLNVDQARLVVEELSSLDPHPGARAMPRSRERIQIALMRRSQPWNASRLEAAGWRALRRIGASAVRRIDERDPGRETADRRIPRQARKALTGLRIVVSDPARKPLGTIVRQAAWFAWRERQLPYSYFVLYLYQRTAGDTAGYVGSRRCRAIRDRLVVPNGESGYTRDKLVFSQRLDAHGLPQPALLAHINDRSVVFDGIRTTLGGPPDLSRLLERLCAASATGAVFLKPVDATQGTHCYRFEPGAEHDTALAWAAMGGRPFIVQEAIEQHAALKAVYPHAVNSIRVHTHRRGGDADVLSAVLRMGRGGMMMDNISAGGIYIPIDLDTGGVGPRAREHFWYGAATFLRHPDTGYRFADLEIPMMDRLLEVSRQGALAFDDPFLGWDIAVTATGPVIIEANVGFHLNLAQVAAGGFRAHAGFSEAFAECL